MQTRKALFVCQTMGYGAVVRVITPVTAQARALQESHRFGQYRYKASALQVKDGWHSRPVTRLPRRKVQQPAYKQVLTEGAYGED